MGLATFIMQTARRWIRRTVGLWPAMELRNRIVMAGSLPGITRFEYEEVARLSRQLGTVPTAAIACIIPTYKRPEGVIAAVNSILAQERQDFVIMVVDDGAGLPALPSDPRLFAVSLSRNYGIAGLVRNVGIRLSHSEFIAFLDDDNMWTPEHLRVAVGALGRDADMIYTAVRRRKPDGSEFDVLSKPFDRRRFSDEPSWVDINAVALRRAVCRPFSRLPRVRTTLPREDWEFVWRVSRHARVKHVPTVTVEYLLNPASHFTSWSHIGI
jgi:glycosyltransferase involved in cell wall biosynthesis